MTLYRLDASIREVGSHSRRLADLAEQEWTASHPGDRVINREIGLAPVPATAWPAAVSVAMAPGGELSPEQREAVDLAATLTDELAAADALIFAVPLYNFGVSQHFKTWVDLVVTDPRMAAGQTSAIAGRPAILATVRGGAYGDGTPREGWDHATPWMRRMLEDVWGLDLRVVEMEFTLAGVSPGLEQFIDLADQMRAEAEVLAAEHGRWLSGSAAPGEDPGPDAAA
jgi:FMN-dependent NADH-azoreductase